MLRLILSASRLFSVFLCCYILIRNLSCVPAESTFSRLSVSSKTQPSDVKFNFGRLFFPGEILFLVPEVPNFAKTVFSEYSDHKFITSPKFLFVFPTKRIWELGLIVLRQKITEHWSGSQKVYEVPNSF